MRVLIIGGTRRSGPYLVRELIADGHEVFIYHRGQNQVTFTDQMTVIQGDRKNYPEFVAQMADLAVDTVIDMIATNDQDIDAIVQTFAGRLRRYVVISSYEVYAAFEAAWTRQTSLQPVPIPETAPSRQSSIVYAQTPSYEKIPMEQAALQAYRLGRLPCTIVRYPALYGPRDVTPREWYYVRQALDRRPWIGVGGGGQSLFSRGYLPNMAHAVVCLLRHPQTDGEIFNAADEMALTNGQIIEMVGQILGHHWEMVPIPRTLMPPFVRSQALPFSPDPYDIEPHLLLDVHKIKCLAGYQDVVPVERALEETVLWLRDHPAPAGFLPVDHAAMDAAIERVAGL